MSLIRIDVENEKFEVETKFYRSRKKNIKTHKTLQVLVEHKFEVFMNLFLFRNVISKFWNEEMNNEVVVMLIRAGMVLVNIRIWKDFILARDSGLVPVAAALCKSESSKPIPEYYGSSKSSKTASENNPETKALKVEGLQAQAIQSQEVLEISSDSEQKISEPKKSVICCGNKGSPKKAPNIFRKNLTLRRNWLTKVG